MLTTLLFTYLTERSGSEHCYGPNRTARDYVIDEALKQQTLLVTLQGFFTVLSLNLLGGIGDFYGRKPVIVLAFVAYIIMFSAYALSAAVLHSFPLVCAAVSLRAALSAFPPMGHAMVADLSSPEERNEFMAVYGIFATAGVITGFGTGYYLLTLHLYNYTPVFIAFIALAVFVTIVAC